MQLPRGELSSFSNNGVASLKGDISRGQPLDGSVIQQLCILAI